MMKNKITEGTVVRTVHHFACSGGTIISKCIAAMPNVLLLSELDPLSPLSPLQNKWKKPEFSPSDIIRLLKHNYKEVSDEVLINIFRASVFELSEYCSKRDFNLVLRDHTHSHYCCGLEINDRDSFLKIFSEVATVNAVLTVRHPLDTYISLVKNGWVHFQPASFDEYCNRYLCFLDEYSGVDVFKYEDFTKRPSEMLEKICVSLNIKFDPNFESYLPAIKLTGDSGRSSDSIQERPRKNVEKNLLQEMSSSKNYQRLCERLSYEE